MSLSLSFSNFVFFTTPEENIENFLTVTKPPSIQLYNATPNTPPSQTIDTITFMYKVMKKLENCLNIKQTWR